MKRFIVGQSYNVSANNEAQRGQQYIIARRSEFFVWIYLVNYNYKAATPAKKRKIHIGHYSSDGRHGVIETQEYCFPRGKYSLCATVWAADGEVDTARIEGK